MKFWPYDIKKSIALFLIILVPLIIIHTEPDSRLMASPFASITGLIQKGFYKLSSGVRGTTRKYLNLIDLRETNRLLSKENLNLKTRLGFFKELHLENERLNKLLIFQKRVKIKTIAAKVIGISLIHESRILYINRGTKQGLKEDMPAMVSGGIIGYTIKVQRNTSQVLLITDRYAVVDSIVQRTRARGLIEGLGSNKCRLSYLDAEEIHVKKGDLLVTSGANQIFPKGFPIGIVSKVEKDKFKMKQYIEVRPLINPQNIEELFIVLDSGKANIGRNKDKDSENRE